MSIRQVIFDCDGVLVDSEPLSMAADCELLRTCGLVLSHEEVSRLFIGKSMAEMILSVERDFGIVLPEDFTAQKDSRILAMYEQSLEAVPGIHEALEAIGVPLGIASNSPRHRVEFALRKTGLDRFFGTRITAVEDVVYPKPAPDIYLLAAERAGVVPSDCLVVEDSVTGVTAAVAAGCRVIGFTATYADGPAHARKLIDAGAGASISHHRELARFL